MGNPFTPQDDGVTKFPRMGDAIAMVEPGLIFGEAKRQFEELQCVLAHESRHTAGELKGQAEQNSHSPSTQEPEFANLTIQRDAFPDIYLAGHYRDQFYAATQDLDDDERYQLLSICFAFKSKDRILAWLDLIREGGPTWATTFTDIIRDRAKDSAFAETDAKSVPRMTHYEEELVGDDSEKENYPVTLQATDRAKERSGRPDSHHSPSPDPTIPTSAACETPSTADTSHLDTPTPLPDLIATALPCSGNNALYFVLPTLPLAFPNVFFSALANHSPLERLTKPNILCYPASLCLGLSPRLKQLQHQLLPNFWKPSPECPISFEEKEFIDEHSARWQSFFEHLSLGQERLLAAKGGYLPCDDCATGYEPEDLDQWIAGWQAYRQMKGLREKGQHIKQKLAERKGNGQGTKRKRPEHSMNEEQEEDSVEGGEKKHKKFKIDITLKSDESSKENKVPVQKVASNKRVSFAKKGMLPVQVTDARPQKGFKEKGRTKKRTKEIA